MVNGDGELDEVFDREANWVAFKSNMHSCGATCVKYSFKQQQETGKNKRRGCRFKAPWHLYDRTEFTADGLFHVQRNHPRVNRYCPALIVGLRHNIDAHLLATNSAGLAIVYYATNYSTKLDSPLWKRASLVRAVWEGLRTEKDAEEQVDSSEAGTTQHAIRNNKTRQLMARVANRIFTNRELSSVEVCANLLGFRNSFSSQGTWRSIHLNTLYWAIFRRWKALREAAGPEIQQTEIPESVTIGQGGVRLPVYEAYQYRGPLLKSVCLYEYLSHIKIQRVGKKTDISEGRYFPFDDAFEGRSKWVQELVQESDQAVPVMTGYLKDDVNGTEPGFYCR